MLIRLKIENYALIKEIDLSFAEGLTVITGETGAGKSIMLGALGLVLGSRADMSVLFDKKKKSIIEAEFKIDKDLKHLFDNHDLDFDTISIFRREILPSGKSRAFINDTPVQLAIMREISEYIMDIHSQNSSFRLKETDYQYEILDSFIQDHTLLKDYSNSYLEWKEISSELMRLRELQVEANKERSYFEFLAEEFEEADIQVGEKEELEKELELISNSETIKTTMVNSLNQIDGEEVSILPILNNIRAELDNITSYHESIQEFYTRINSVYIELKDLNDEMVYFDANISFDANRLDLINERLNILYSLEKKHSVSSEEELLKIYSEISDKLLEGDSLGDKINDLEKKESQIHSRLKELAGQITKEREEASNMLSQSILYYFQNLGLEDAVFKPRIETVEELNPYGENKIEFLFNANKGGELNEVSKVISGGELSRLILSLKALRAETSPNNTNLSLIFDEIDSGVSGDIASKVGNIMQGISKKFQVITITHLPQIAAKGSTHLKVSKESTEDSTISQISKLSHDERVNEIALMLSSEKITEAAIQNARELLS